jgi:hypothetical protein
MSGLMAVSHEYLRFLHFETMNQRPADQCVSPVLLWAASWLRKRCQSTMKIPSPARLLQPDVLFFHRNKVDGRVS